MPRRWRVTPSTSGTATAAATTRCTATGYRTRIICSLEKATSASNAINTSQLALPEDVCKAAYATSGYEKSVSTLSRVTLDSDNVFGDGHDWQVATVTGDATTGYKVALVVGVEG